MDSDPSTLRKTYPAASWERQKLALKARERHAARVARYRASLDATHRALLDLLLYVPRCRVCGVMPSIGVQSGQEGIRPVCDACRVKSRAMEWRGAQAYSVRYAIRKLGEAHVRDAARLIRDMRRRA